MTLYEKLENEFNEFCDSHDCEVDKCKYWWTVNKDMCRSHFILTKLEEIDIDKEKEQIRADAIDEVKIEYKRMFNCGYTDCVTCNAYCNARKFMDKLEQMKEQNGK